MEYIYLIDWLTSKVIKCRLPAEQEAPKYGTKALYSDDEGKQCVGTVLGYPRECQRLSKYIGAFTTQQTEQFAKNQEKALSLFPSFKKQFKVAFPESVPVTARMNLTGNEIYFYFFAEVRFNFSEFVRNFRQEVGMNFFLYQVGARERIRLDPHADGMMCASGHGTGLDCKTFHHPLPTFDTEVLVAQQLEGRDVEKLKGLCGKLKCSLIYEQDRYISEARKFPRRGHVFVYEKERVKCIGVNLVTGEIKLRKEEGGQIFKITGDEWHECNRLKTPPVPPIA